MISKKDVEHIARLARLGLSQAEIKKFRRELSSVLDYIEKLKEVDVSKVKPLTHPRLVENIIREDKEKSKIQNSKKLLNLVPNTKDGYLKVKSIL